MIPMTILANEPALCRGGAIGPYALIEQISLSPACQVWEAVHVSSGKIVALKFAHPELDTATIEAVNLGLANEYEVARNLQHPNIVSYIELMTGPISVLVMECLTGRSLASVVETERFAWHQVGPFLTQIAYALAYAHTQGVMHLDVKPANIVLAGAARGAVLVDFNISRVTSDSALRRSGIIRPIHVEDTMQSGTIQTSPGYASPEQIKEDQLTPQADVYGLGATLFRVLSGQLVFPGTNPVEVCRKHLFARPPRLNVRNVPSKVAAITDSCLAKQPQDRPTALQVAHTLQYALL